MYFVLNQRKWIEINILNVFITFRSESAGELFSTKKNERNLIGKRPSWHACYFSSPIGETLSDINAWFIDLPGFGRIPYHHEPSVIKGYVESVTAMIMELNRPVTLMGHSFGGLIAARVMQRQPSLIHQLIMLQPVLHPVEPKYRNI
ncbi:lysophospholipase [Paenibacillus sp. HWE-109]|uniref:alpha/beta hydrolase n=1 Tax=Paenibacillus sp. HWE-109 TaxID=1306526 RepID=UPI001EE093E7|nr:alpha/beta fold hydrolase [Paenibacillus sp. HWE-109]UKS26309.1 lysophospholipase [Paenibacillus sp. HWE-109]